MARGLRAIRCMQHEEKLPRFTQAAPLAVEETMVSLACFLVRKQKTKSLCI